MDQSARKAHGHDQALASDAFDKFCNANTLKDILGLYKQLCCVCKLVPTRFHDFFPKLRSKIPTWRAEELWSRFEKKASEKCFARGRHCSNTKVLVIGSGPCGLRAAIDAQLLGAKVVVIEKRDTLSRNNVLHLWPFVIADLRSLGAKALYGKFCAGSIDHISIRQIQCILLKVALLLGVEFYEGVGFQGVIEPSSVSADDGWRARLSPSAHPVAQYQFDVILGADGRRSILSSGGFKRKALRAKLAIAITANFINKHTEAEAKVEEISGVSYIFKQQFFQDLDEAMGIALENIVYYKDETHYFVMTPKKQSLLEKRVLYQDFPEPELLLSPENVDQEALQRFTMEAVVFATDNHLPELEFALNHYGEPDVAVFDFTTMYASENACRALQRKGHKLLVGLVGDALLEPFWPTGSGCARGFLSSYDAAWMIRAWGKGLNSVLEVLAERESIYRLLGQTTPENLNKDHNQYTIDPRTRYPKINLGLVNARQVPYLYDSDVAINDIFDPIRDPSSESKEFILPQDFLLKWIQAQVGPRHVQVASIADVFNGANALTALVSRYRPDLIEHPLPLNIEPFVRNQLIFEILQDEINVDIPMHCEKSVCCGDGELSIISKYLSQIYLRFKGDIPRENAFSHVSDSNAYTLRTNRSAHVNNSKLHHSLSIKEFLRAKEILERNRKGHDDNQSKREKRRSQIYDALLQSESQNGLQRSATSISVVIPVVKLNPVPPGELFAACRQGREKSVAYENRPASVASAAPCSRALLRSRSDVGFRRGPSPLAAPIPPTQSRSFTNSSQLRQAVNLQQEEEHSEAQEMQMKIMKRRATPAGGIISTFLQKQALAAETNEEQENWTKRQIRDMRARSLTQNSFNGWAKKETEPTFTDEPVSDLSFKDRCKFLEKNIYNSGRDIKVHCPSAPWFTESAHSSKSTSPISPPPIQTSASSVFLAARQHLERHQNPDGLRKPHANSQPTRPPEQAVQKPSRIPHHQFDKGQQAARMQSIEKKLQSTVSGMRDVGNGASIQSAPPMGGVTPTHYQINGQIIHPGNKRNGTSSQNTRNNTRLNANLISPQPQNLRRSATSIGIHGVPHNLCNVQTRGQDANVTAFINARVVTDSSGESDNDLDFLKGIDFETLDGQELQELLSSF